MAVCFPPLPGRRRKDNKGQVILLKKANLSLRPFCEFEHDYYQLKFGAGRSAIEVIVNAAFEEPLLSAGMLAIVLQ